jgi:hypothetical protein
MATITKYYETAAQAQSAYKSLLRSGLNQNSIAIITPSSQTDSSEATKVSELLSAAMKAGSLLTDQVDTHAHYLDKGYSLVAVIPPFGRSEIVTSKLDSFEPIETHVNNDQNEIYPQDVRYTTVSKQAAPFSSALGLPVLTKRINSRPLAIRPSKRSFLSCFFGELTRSDFALFGSSKLSSNVAPLSRMFGLPTKSGKSGSHWTRSFGFKMLSNHATPLSALIGVPTISGKYDTESYSPSQYRSSIRHKAAPLSGLFGIKTISNNRQTFLSRMFPALTKANYSLFGTPNLSNKAAILPFPVKSGKSGTSWKSSFGIPLLSRNPAPLSSLLGMSPLSRYQGS